MPAARTLQTGVITSVTSQWLAKVSIYRTEPNLKRRFMWCYLFCLRNLLGPALRRRLQGSRITGTVIVFIMTVHLQTHTQIQKKHSVIGTYQLCPLCPHDPHSLSSQGRGSAVTLKKGKRSVSEPFKFYPFFSLLKKHFKKREHTPPFPLVFLKTLWSKKEKQHSP